MAKAPKTCGLCGQSYIGYCNHGTAWETESYKPPIKKELGGLVVKYNALTDSAALPPSVTKAYFQQQPQSLTRFICRKCQVVFESAKPLGMNYCLQCESREIEITELAIGKVFADWDTPSELPRCALCGECPSADDLAEKQPGWLCCDPLPIMKPRRILSA